MATTAFVYAILAASANVVGAVAVAVRKRWSVEALDLLVALSAGFMLSVALAELVPEAVAHRGASAGSLILIGYLMVHITQHTLAPHFHFGEERHTVTHSVGVSALIGLLLHTFIDGVAIASGFHVSMELGMLLSIAILLHKLPEGFAISSLFLAGGSSRGNAVAAGAALGISTLLGFFLTEQVQALTSYGIELAAGVTLYVAASNLIPEMQRRHRWRNSVTFIAGCVLFFIAHKLI